MTEFFRQPEETEIKGGDPGAYTDRNDSEVIVEESFEDKSARIKSEIEVLKAAAVELQDGEEQKRISTELAYVANGLSQAETPYALEEITKGLVDLRSSLEKNNSTEEGSDDAPTSMVEEHTSEIQSQPKSEALSDLSDISLGEPGDREMCDATLAYLNEKKGRVENEARAVGIQRKNDPNFANLLENLRQSIKTVSGQVIDYYAEENKDNPQTLSAISNRFATSKKTLEGHLSNFDAAIQLVTEQVDQKASSSTEEDQNSEASWTTSYYTLLKQVGDIVHTSETTGEDNPEVANLKALFVELYQHADAYKRETEPSQEDMALLQKIEAALASYGNDATKETEEMQTTPVAPDAVDENVLKGAPVSQPGDPSREVRRVEVPIQKEEQELFNDLNKEILDSETHLNEMELAVRVRLQEGSVNDSVKHSYQTMYDVYRKSITDAKNALLQGAELSELQELVLQMKGRSEAYIFARNELLESSPGAVDSHVEVEDPIMDPEILQVGEIPPLVSEQSTTRVIEETIGQEQPEDDTQVQPNEASHEVSSFTPDIESSREKFESTFQEAGISLADPGIRGLWTQFLRERDAIKGLQGKLAALNKPKAGEVFGLDEEALNRERMLTQERSQEAYRQFEKISSWLQEAVESKERPKTVEKLVSEYDALYKEVDVLHATDVPKAIAALSVEDYEDTSEQFFASEQGKNLSQKREELVAAKTRLESQLASLLARETQLTQEIAKYEAKSPGDQEDGQTLAYLSEELVDEQKSELLEVQELQKRIRDVLERKTTVEVNTQPVQEPKDPVRSAENTTEPAEVEESEDDNFELDEKAKGRLDDEKRLREVYEELGEIDSKDTAVTPNTPPTATANNAPTTASSSVPKTSPRYIEPPILPKFREENDDNNPAQPKRTPEPAPAEPAIDNYPERIPFQVQLEHSAAYGTIEQLKTVLRLHNKMPLPKERALDAESAIESIENLYSQIDSPFRAGSSYGSFDEKKLLDLKPGSEHSKLLSQLPEEYGIRAAVRKLLLRDMTYPEQAKRLAGQPEGTQYENLGTGEAEPQPPSADEKVRPAVSPQRTVESTKRPIVANPAGEHERASEDMDPLIDEFLHLYQENSGGISIDRDELLRPVFETTNLDEQNERIERLLQHERALQSCEVSVAELETIGISMTPEKKAGIAFIQAHPDWTLAQVENDADGDVVQGLTTLLVQDLAASIPRREAERLVTLLARGNIMRGAKEVLLAYKGVIRK